MKELSISNLTKTYGTKILLENLDFSIITGDHIGLIGPNGTGKSSLLKVIAGLDNYDEGIIKKPNDYSIAYLSQNPSFETNKTILETVYDSKAPMIQLILEYERAQYQLENDPFNEKYQNNFNRLSEEMTIKNAWDVEVKAKTILSQLQLTDLSQSIDSCSGGQLKRIGIAQVLIAEPDLLILDEPTNHLDVDSIQWLENYLASFQGAFLLVTHDRYFLERSVNKICELKFGSITEYSGNYEEYLEKKTNRLAQEAKSQSKQDRLFVQELAWMRKGAKARTTKQQARIDRFNDLKSTIQERNEDLNDISFNFDQQRIGNQILEFDKTSIRIGSHQVITNLSKTLVKGDRIGIIGPNGIGKSTFLNVIAGNLKPISGDISIGQTVRLAYYRQLDEDLPNDKMILSYLKEIADNFKRPDGSTASAAQMLERFNFPRNTHGMKIGQLSGGERRRLYLLTLLIQEPNVLLLDEPTNDLDIDTLTVLEDYIEQFVGVVIVVSHDRYFLDKIADQLLILKGNGEFDWTWDAYSEYLTKSKLEKAQKTKAIKLESDKDDSQLIKEKSKKMSYLEKKEWENIESDIANSEDKIDSLQNEMIANTHDAAKLMELQEELDKQENVLMELYERFDYLSQLS